MNPYNNDEHRVNDRKYPGHIRRNIKNEMNRTNRTNKRKASNGEGGYMQSYENLITSEVKCAQCAERPKVKYLLQFLSFAVLTLVAVICYIKRPSEECLDHDNRPGSCKYILDCPFALKDILSKKQLVICSKEDDKLAICCEDKEDVPDLQTRFVLTGNELEKNEYKTNDKHKEEKPIVFKDSFEDTSECPEPPHTIPKPEKQRISVRKCLEYQEKLVFPCRESITPNGGMVRLNRCKWKPESLIINGENAYHGEFPHMALLGYNTTVDTWKCGGFIVSERFILTAAHCTYATHAGVVTHVKIGVLNRSEESNYYNTYKVKNIYKHRKYNSPSEYNDIALLETDRDMKLYQFAIPACLHDGSPINDNEVIATGWGTVRYKPQHFIDTLQKTTLDKFSDEECLHNVPPLINRYLKQGYDKHTQICYGDKLKNRDTCNGDSGGPTQIKHPHVTCMYLVTGITSNGKWCGVRHRPGLYTRVSFYLDWIESIVWPAN